MVIEMIAAAISRIGGQQLKTRYKRSEKEGTYIDTEGAFGFHGCVEEAFSSSHVANAAAQFAAIGDHFTKDFRVSAVHRLACTSARPDWKIRQGPPFERFSTHIHHTQNDK